MRNDNTHVEQKSNYVEASLGALTVYYSYNELIAVRFKDEFYILKNY